MSPHGRMLVTGGLGLIGAALARRLATEENEVVLLDNSSGGPGAYPEARARVNLVIGDITRPDDFRRLPEGPWNAVFHLAAQANVPESVRDPRLDFLINAEGTLNVLEWARKQEVGRLVYASTVAVYAAGARMPLREESPLGPSSPYGASKLAGEALVSAFHRTYGVPGVVLRLFNVYGEGMTKYVIHDLVRKLMADPDHLEILGTGEQVRDYIHTSDAARAFELAAACAAPGTILNVGSGRPVRIRDLADEIITVMGLGDVQKSYTGASWAGDVDEWYADTSQIQALGWTPEIPLTEGLRGTVEWLLSHPGEAR